jgi:ABC-type polar amino acid transport system ATPase subunit
LITLDKVVKRYGSQEVLRGASLSVAKGEVSVLLGPSGSGKSSLLRTINGLEPFHGGRIEVCGTTLPFAEGPERERALTTIRRHVGMVFQAFHLFPHRSVLDNVIEAPVHVLRLSRDAAVERARVLLDRVGMLDKANERPTALSGGQQQRVAIARTLAMQPAAILFDEPTSALDPATTAEVIAVMQDLARGGQGMIVVTHGMSFARAVAHSVHILSGGVVVESGTPQQVFSNPQQEATRNLLAEAR